MHLYEWLMWSAVLFLQNISFTYVSRARSSGSIVRHAKASVFSNGIWIVSQMVMLGPMLEYLTGKHGHALQAVTGAVYTVSAVGGSLFAHYLAMRTEKGKDAVGFNKKYAQIPVEDWTRIKALVEATSPKVSELPTAQEFGRVRSLAEAAHDVAMAFLPDSGVRATKVGDLTVTTGLPSGV